MEGLTPGRIVHIVWSDGEHYPAIVTHVPFVNDEGVLLTMFRPYHAPEPLPMMVRFDLEKNQMTWHFPERV